MTQDDEFFEYFKLRQKYAGQPGPYAVVQKETDEALFFGALEPALSYGYERFELDDWWLVDTKPLTSLEIEWAANYLASKTEYESWIYLLNGGTQNGNVN